MQNLTSNQFFGGMNNRFAKRSALLRSLGFKYVSLADFNLAVFCRNSRMRTKQDAITAEFVMHACKRSWNEKLALTLTRGR